MCHDDMWKAIVAENSIRVTKSAVCGRQKGRKVQYIPEKADKWDCMEENYSVVEKLRNVENLEI